MAVQADTLVLITGSTGFVGFATLVATLKAGYTVRATVRREEQAASLKSNAELSPYLSRLEFVIVPDITVAGAFDTAIKDVTHVLNVASPIPGANDDPYENLILPAVESTRHLLEAAKKTPTIRRLVVTSSVLAIVYNETLLGRRTESTPAILTSEIRVQPLPTGPWKDVALTPAYAASKTLALDLLDKAATSRPGFDIISILPGVVVGPSGLYTSTAAMTAPGFGSNSLMLNLALGRRMEGTPFPLGLIGITDVARIHIAALDAAVVPGPSATFILDAERPSYDEIKEIVKKHFPEKVADGTFSEDGTWTMLDLKMDTSDTVQTFGKLDSYESDVVKLIEQYLELKQKEAK